MVGTWALQSLNNKKAILITIHYFNVYSLHLASEYILDITIAFRLDSTPKENFFLSGNATYIAKGTLYSKFVKNGPQVQDPKNMAPYIYSKSKKNAW